jgi:siroheme synthase-like protein
MSLFPILIDMQDMPCLVAGGGALALHKAELLCAQGAKVTVVAPEICDEIRELPVTVHCREVAENDTDGMILVVDATANDRAERILKDACSKRKIPFNSACKGNDTTAVFPAVHRQGRTVIAVSSTGASPAASTWLRDRFAEYVPDRMDDILECMVGLRPLSREYFGEQSVRKLFLRRCLDTMLENNRPLTGNEIEELRYAIEKT